MILNSPTISGSLTVTGNIIASGSITLSGSVASASYAANAELLDGLDSTVFTLTSSFAAQTASFTAFTASLNAFSASQNSFTASILAQTASLNAFSASILSYTASQNILNGTYTLTSSFAAQTASFTAFTASILAQTASLNSFSASVLTFTGSASTRLGALESYTSSLNNKTSSFATTGSNTFIGTQTITGSVLQSGSFTSTGTLTAQTLVVQTITSSVVYSSGSNIFGNALNNTQTFTGSVLITGSLTIAGGSSATSYNGTTIYGSTAVCSPVGKFTTCIDVSGTGRFYQPLTNSTSYLVVENNRARNAAVYTVTTNGGFYAGTSIGTDTFNYQIYDGVAGSARLTIASTGAATFACSVGIGVSPSFPLEISSATGNQLKMSTNDATSANNAGIFFYNEASATSSTRRSYMLLDPNGANGSGGDYAYFDMYGSGTVRVMNQLTSGVLALGVGGTNIINITGSNVGIGTTIPASQSTGTTTGILDVSAATGGNLVLHRTSGGDTALLSILKGSNGTFIDSTGAATAANNAIYFRTNNINADQTSLTTALTIASTGAATFASSLYAASVISSGTSIAAATYVSAPSGFYTTSNNNSIPFTTWTTITTVDSNIMGMYLVVIGLTGGGLSDWAATGILYSNGTTASWIVGPTNGSLVQLRISGTSIQVYQNGGSPSQNLSYKLLKIA